MYVTNSEFYECNGVYNLKKSGEGKKNTDEMIKFLQKLDKDYSSIIIIEDAEVIGKDGPNLLKLLVLRFKLLELIYLFLT